MKLLKKSMLVLSVMTLIGGMSFAATAKNRKKSIAKKPAAKRVASESYTCGSEKIRVAYPTTKTARVTTKAGKVYNLNVAVLIQTLVYAILGILQGLAGKVFQSKLNDNIVIVFVSHYFLIMLPLVLAGYYLKWFSSFTTLILMLIIATIVYILIGIARYLSIKKGIREINIKLNNNR